MSTEMTAVDTSNSTIVNPRILRQEADRIWHALSRIVNLPSENVAKT